MQTVQAEPNQLLDCLINLFRNAIDAMPNGGTITIDASEKSENGKRFVILRISDTGSGIPRKYIDRIFEPLFSTKNSGSGIGMGLTVVKNAVESWGGQVKVRSRPGEGATFRIFLPKAKAKPFRRKKPALAMGGETVLVTDDKQDVLAEAAQTLERAGYSVMTATNADECVSLYREHSGKIHLTIVDAVMPGKNGKDVLQEILKLDPTASVIMTSGFSKDYVRSYLQVGAWGFVQKPFDTGQLLSVVRRTLDQRQATATTSNNRHRKEQNT
jgi:CheY-like chemotaxis protein